MIEVPKPLPDFDLNMANTVELPSILHSLHLTFWLCQVAGNLFSIHEREISVCPDFPYPKKQFNLMPIDWVLIRASSPVESAKSQVTTESLRSL